MKNNLNDIVSKLNEIYKVYEEVCWHYDDTEIVVVFDNNTITLYLNNPIENKDTFGISFNPIEKNVYKYISLKFFDLLLGDVYIYNQGNVFYNQKHKPYLTVIVTDEVILRYVGNLVINQSEKHIKSGINDICKKEPFKVYSKKFLNNFDDRISLSKRMLWSDQK